MNSFEQPTLCGCEKPDCYFCNQRKISPWMFAGLPEENRKSFVTPDSVFRAVCRQTGVDPEIVKSKVRNCDTVMVRMIYCYLARMETDASLSDIGKVIGRNHTSVIYFNRRVQELIDIKDSKMMNVYNKVKRFNC